MATVLLLLTLGAAGVDWAASEKDWRRLHFIFKPAVLLLMIAWFSVAVGWGGGNLWFGLALVFSLLGDVNLLFPGRLFMPGLAAFLLAHILYIVGFSQAPLVLQLPQMLAVLALAIGAFVFVFSRLWSGLAHIEGGRRMLLPVIFYSVTITLRVVSAWLCLFRPAWPVNAALAVGLGSLLFFCSDSLLAYNRYVRKTAHHDLLVMSAYHLGQIGIVAGVILAGLA
jgi:uncharacterized membrane protein YhhN